MKTLLSLVGWEEASIDDYRECYHIYGGGLATHPIVLDFIHMRFKCDEKYYVQRDSNRLLTAAISVWGGKFLANDPCTPLSKYIRIAIPNDELIIPASPENKFILPIKSKFISPLNRKNVINSTYIFNANRRVCIAKELGNGGISIKSQKKYKDRLKLFLKIGGKVVDCESFSPRGIADIYFSLTEKRWGSCCVDRELTQELFELIQPLIWGNILFYNDEACAFHFITKTFTSEHTIFEFIQAGMDTSNELQKHSIGSLLIWSNIERAHSQYENARYSFGCPSREYKLRWCNLQPIGRVLSL
ncbi:GNAT family N-acetyltransferase [Photorhabdus bodei]|uniref:GNAT family N-acetyltransferase n=1 Tax=Photorhabdus bodei TaxID=2029681 RepID=A0AAW6BIU2_9GAMM|nr:GNAT family N-acetyltransferase [Photorhabdus bodei]MDB6372501.1 GNAT family N-acetyltransferase [Photorhabdus bodei]